MLGCGGHVCCCAWPGWPGRDGRHPDGCMPASQMASARLTPTPAAPGATPHTSRRYSATVVSCPSSQLITRPPAGGASPGCSRPPRAIARSSALLRSTPRRARRASAASIPANTDEPSTPASSGSSLPSPPSPTATGFLAKIPSASPSNAMSSARVVHACRTMGPLTPPPAGAAAAAAVSPPRPSSAPHDASSPAARRVRNCPP